MFSDTAAQFETAAIGPIHLDNRGAWTQFLECFEFTAAARKQSQLEVRAAEKMMS
jgi:hypothetical protein